MFIEYTAKVNNVRCRSLIHFYFAGIGLGLNMLSKLMKATVLSGFLSNNAEKNSAVWAFVSIFLYSQSLNRYVFDLPIYAQDIRTLSMNGEGSFLEIEQGNANDKTVGKFLNNVTIYIYRFI